MPDSDSDTDYYEFLVVCPKIQRTKINLLVSCCMSMTILILLGFFIYYFQMSINESADNKIKRFQGKCNFMDAQILIKKIGKYNKFLGQGTISMDLYAIPTNISIGGKSPSHIQLLNLYKNWKHVEEPSKDDYNNDRRMEENFVIDFKQSLGPPPKDSLVPQYGLKRFITCEIDPNDLTNFEICFQSFLDPNKIICKLGYLEDNTWLYFFIPMLVLCGLTCCCCCAWTIGKYRAANHKEE